MSAAPIAAIGAAMPAGAATTRPGNVAVPTAWVKNARRRRAIHAPNRPPATPSSATASSARCMYGVVKGSIRASTDEPAHYRDPFSFSRHGEAADADVASSARDGDRPEPLPRVA